MRVFALAMILTGAAASALADLPPTESGTVGERRVTIYTWQFLSADELAVLREALADGEALTAMVADDVAGAFSAVAVSPDEPFLAEGGLVAPGQSAVGFPTLVGAWTAAYEACNALRMGQTDCIIVLEVAPK